MDDKAGEIAEKSETSSDRETSGLQHGLDVICGDCGGDLKAWPRNTFVRVMCPNCWKGDDISSVQWEGEDSVYFISDMSDDGPIKVGMTKGNPFARMAELQTGNPRRLRILGVMRGDADLERLFHRLFARGRLSGEWFGRTPALMAIIAEFAREA